MIRFRTSSSISVTGKPRASGDDPAAPLATVARIW